MAEPKPREKFWVTDPPATFDDEDEGVVLICAFSSRKTLKAFYDSQGLADPTENYLQIRRYGKLKEDCRKLGWDGLAIDPDPETGRCRVIRYGRGVEPAVDAEPEPPAPPTKSAIVTDGLGFTPRGQ